MTSAAKLKSYVERIVRLMDARDDLLADVRGVLDEAKDAQLVPKILRQVVRRVRAKDPAALASDDALLESYLEMMDTPLVRAVEMARAGATADEIAQETGLKRATAARAVSLKKNRETTIAGDVPPNGNTVAHDPTVPSTPTGEVIEDAAPQPEVSNGEDVRDSGRADPERPVPAADGAEGHSSDGGGEAGAVDAADAGHAEPARDSVPCEEPPRAAEVESKPALSDEAALSRMLEAEAGAPFLRRERVAAI